MNAKIKLPPQIPAAKVEQVQNRPRPCDKNLAVAKEKTPTWKKKNLRKKWNIFPVRFPCSAHLWFGQSWLSQPEMEERYEFSQLSWKVPTGYSK